MQPPVVGTCYSCDRQGIPVFDVFAYDGQSRFCGQCIKKYGKDQLAAAANAALAAKNAKPIVNCIRCGEKLIIGTKQPMCSGCVNEYAKVFGKGVKFI